MEFLSRLYRPRHGTRLVGMPQGVGSQWPRKPQRTAKSLSGVCRGSRPGGAGGEALGASEGSDRLGKPAALAENSKGDGGPSARATSGAAIRCSPGLVRGDRGRGGIERAALERISRAPQRLREGSGLLSGSAVGQRQTEGVRGGGGRLGLCRGQHRSETI